MSCSIDLWPVVNAKVKTAMWTGLSRIEYVIIFFTLFIFIGNYQEIIYKLIKLLLQYNFDPSFNFPYSLF